MAASHLDENDLLRHTAIRQFVTGEEAVWIRSIAHASGSSCALVELSVDNLTLVGPTDAVVDRLTAALALIDSALRNRERWQDLNPEIVDGELRVGKRPHPFCDRPRRRNNDLAPVDSYTDESGHDR